MWHVCVWYGGGTHTHSTFFKYSVRRFFEELQLIDSCRRVLHHKKPLQSCQNMLNGYYIKHIIVVVYANLGLFGDLVRAL